MIRKVELDFLCWVLVIFDDRPSTFGGFRNNVFYFKIFLSRHHYDRIPRVVVSLNYLVKNYILYIVMKYNCLLFKTIFKLYEKLVLTVYFESNGWYIHKSVCFLCRNKPN